MTGEIHVDERNRVLASVILTAILVFLFCYLAWLLVREDDQLGRAIAMSAAYGGHLSPTDSVRVAGFRERAREIAKAGRLEVLDVTWVPFPPTSSLYVLLQKEGAGGMEDRTVFHLVSGESPRFGDWAKLRQGDRIGLEFTDLPRESVYLGPFAGPQDYLVPRSVGH